jgi:hypothetical protein
MSFLDGLALAATLAGDRGGAAAPGLAADLAAAVESKLEALRALEGKARERAIAAMAAGLRPSIDPGATLPARAAAILAPEVPREVGARWIDGAPPPRAGFRAHASLRATLRRLARRDTESAHRDRDRDRGRSLLRHAIAGGVSEGEALGALDAGERDAVLAAPEAGDASARARWAALARAAIDAGAGSDLARALGAMERGAAGGGGPSERAGRECAAVWERAWRA